MKVRKAIGVVMAAGMLAGACLLAPMQASAASGDQLSLTAIGQFFFPASVPVTTQAGLRRIDLRAIVGSDRVGIDITRITFNTDYAVDAQFVCTGGREASVVYSGDDPVSSLDDRFLNCGFGRRGESIFGAIGIFEP
jgi:hypothetical protein